MHMALLAFSLLFMTGCMHITTNLTPVTEQVKPVLIGEDCVPIILGLAYGTSTVEQAMRNGELRTEQQSLGSHQTIKVIRSIALTETAWFLFGARCLEVVGE